VLLAGCSGGEEEPAPLEAIRESGELRVLTRNAPTTFYFGREGKAGLEYELARRFAEDLGVDLELVVKDSVAATLDALAKGQGHIAAAGVTRTREREERFLFGPSYQQVQQQVVCRRGGPVPGDWEDLPDVGLLVRAGTSYVQRLRDIRQVIHDLEWREVDSLSSDQILAKIWRGEADCTVADSNIVAVNQRYYPELKVAFPITEQQKLAWPLPKEATALKKRLAEWFAKQRAGNELAAIRERYYGHVQVFDYVDIATFKQRIDTRLPRFRETFQKWAAHYNFPWELVAAQAYQESHWRPRAESPTGVRGIMMLTQVTARSLDIENRLDVEASIRGGAAYLRKMMERLPEDIEKPDRTWIALAAYNVGMGHIWDARRLARRFDRDPDQWNTLKEMLPLLTRPKYYKELPYGYARGTEPVNYVERIRQYSEILHKASEDEAKRMEARRE
jgi:membrane-bound lytic murein transglycosylase F